MNLERIVTTLIADEGYRGHPYDDATGQPVEAPAGRLTVGYGSNLADDPLSPHLAGILLRDRLTVAIVDALHCIPRLGQVDEERQEVLVQMAYQLGRRGLLSFRKMRAAIASDDWEAAAREALDSNVAREQAPARWQRHARILRGHA